MREVTCPDCGFEDVIASAGTHVSAGGAVSVYSQDEVFVCPHCDFSKRARIVQEEEEVEQEEDESEQTQVTGKK